MASKWGVHPNYNKITSNSSIEEAKLPSKIILPLSQHIGSQCEPLVNIGDKIDIGQKIAESDSFVSAPIHSSISGVVKSIEEMPHPITGKLVKSIIIESDGVDAKFKAKKRNYSSLSSKELLDIIKDAGIVGLGGAAFPTHIKLSPPKDKKIDVLIINGAECEPYLTSDHRMMVEKADEIIQGIEIIKKILSPSKVYIGIENNKKDAIKILRIKADENNIRVVSLPTRYPQGAEKMLIHSITKRKVPAGGLPMDAGCVVQNASTAAAIYQAVSFSKPLYERVVTITGKVNNPKNILARIGTPISELIEMAGGYKGEPKKLLNGGPMMGIALPSDDLPIIKGTSGIVVMSQKDLFKAGMPIECIRCGRCVKECPMHLNPSYIAKYSEKARMDLADDAFAMDCIECGCCSFGCPSKIALVHWIRHAKNEIMKNRKKQEKQKNQ